MSVHTARTDPHTAQQGTQVSIQSVGIPNRVQPNTTINAQTTVLNGAEFINPVDPDICNPGALFISGLQLRVRLMVNGTTVDRGTQCVAGLGGTQTYDLSWATPSQPGEVTVTVVVEGAASGEEKARQERTVEVASSAPEEPEEPRNGGGGSIFPPIGGGGGEGGGPLTDFGGVFGNPLVILAFLLVVLFILTSASSG